ncbi:hypothetical protein N9491_06305 [Planktomarina temperata]|nr:hypothetical protein [Planktomarina temperata]
MVKSELNWIMPNRCDATDADYEWNVGGLIQSMIRTHCQDLKSKFMANPFAFEQADDQRFVQNKIAPGIYRSDLFILTGGEVTQFTRYHIRAMWLDVPLRSKVTLH